MEFYTPRKLKFKAWNTESQLLMRLNSIDCVKGELVKKGHILLQYTEMTDKQSEELYELDVVLIDGDKYVIVWEKSPAGWFLVKLSDPLARQILLQEQARTAVRLCSYFESTKK
jgi:hypothetical protein